MISIEIVHPQAKDQSFAERFLKAITQPALKRIYNKGWTPEYLQELGLINSIMADKEICSHDMQHFAHVAHNGLMLEDIAEKTKGYKYTDTEVFVYALTHDIGYASEEVVWRDRHGINHAKESAHMLSRFINPADNNYTMYWLAVTAPKENILRLVQEYINNNKLIPRNLFFALMMQTADKLDYFRAERVSHVNPPVSFIENPYYFLAKAVKRYKIIEENNTLVYEVDLNNTFSFDTWRKAIETEDYLEEIFSMARLFCKTGGKNFVIRPVTYF